MSPFVRPKFRTSDSSDGSGVRLRLNILTVLVVLQLVLTVFLLCSRPAAENADVKPNIVKEDKEQAKVEVPPVKVEKKTEPVRKEEPKQVVAPEPEKRLDWSKIQIDVLNGCGEKGIARKASNWMKKRGYKIHDATNADRHDYPESFIKLRKGDREAAVKLADDLGINRTRVFDDRSEKEEKVNLTLVIGLDFGGMAFDR